MFEILEAPKQLGGGGGMGGGIDIYKYLLFMAKCKYEIAINYLTSPTQDNKKKENIYNDEKYSEQHYI